MRKTYITILITGFILVFQSCNNNTDYEDRERDEISLSSQSETTLNSGTRAVGNFPNDGTIGLFAANQYDPANPQYTNWRAYSDINNAKATASSVSGGVYSFTWDEKKFWPFDGSNLYFASYSPYTTPDNPNYTLPASGTSLYIAMNGNVPDVMYASGNTNPQPFNKTMGTVNLGEFQHALSQVTIQIIAENGMPSSIRATGLSITTAAISGTLNVLEGENGMDVNIQPTTPVTIDLVSGSVDFSVQSISRSQLLFAGTQDYTQITISLEDTATNSTFSRSYNMSSFTNNLPDELLKLERAKNTILKIFVRVVNVENPEATIQLEGLITDWNDQGRYGIDVQ